MTELIKAHYALMAFLLAQCFTPMVRGTEVDDMPGLAVAILVAHVAVGLFVVFLGVTAGFGVYSWWMYQC